MGQVHNKAAPAVLICQLHAICKRQADASARRILARRHEWHVQNEAAVKANKRDTSRFAGTIRGLSSEFLNFKGRPDLQRRPAEEQSR